MSIDENSKVIIGFANCDVAPECTSNEDFVRAGDIVQIGGVFDEDLTDRYSEADPSKLDAVLQRHKIPFFDTPSC